ncbi:hypothetical protein OCL06_15280 [Alteromonas sp. ASW11-19]|uniref:DUF6868 domain-containing protein n=1 Tax=Alteromonas salexigens TaxID=2982530 RepID=A0ABT2VRN3_9ALTE|nr:hypothetical protein [Alteromonas salexigens]MCU7555951.1 hypothetical protein [Alteromonas salexigens]
MSELSSFFGWMSVINIGILSVMGLAITLGRRQIASIHHALFNLSQPELYLLYFKFLAAYKLLTLFFCVVPWLALQL